MDVNGWSKVDCNKLFSTPLYIKVDLFHWLGYRTCRLAYKSGWLTRRWATKDPNLYQVWPQAPVLLKVFPSKFKSMEILCFSHLDSNRIIATKFCACHDSCAVVACAKICRNLMAGNGITARQNFHRIWIEGKNCQCNGPQAPIAPQPKYTIKKSIY